MLATGNYPAEHVGTGGWWADTISSMSYVVEVGKTAVSINLMSHLV